MWQKMILQMMQEILMYRIFHGKIDAMKCCTAGHLRLNGSFERRILTNLGEFKMTFWRVSCSACEKLFALATIHSLGALPDENQ